MENRAFCIHLEHWSSFSTQSSVDVDSHHLTLPLHSKVMSSICMPYPADVITLLPISIRAPSYFPFAQSAESITYYRQTREGGGRVCCSHSPPPLQLLIHLLLLLRLFPIPCPLFYHPRPTCACTTPLTQHVCICHFAFAPDGRRNNRSRIAP